MRVLLANEPRSCREVFAGAFRALHPHVGVITVEPGDLEGEAPRLRPDVVVCNRITPALDGSQPENRSPTLMPTSDTNRPNPGLETLLAFVDRSESILKNHRSTGGQK